MEIRKILETNKIRGKVVRLLLQQGQKNIKLNPIFFPTINGCETTVYITEKEGHFCAEYSRAGNPTTKGRSWEENRVKILGEDVNTLSQLYDVLFTFALTNGDIIDGVPTPPTFEVQTINIPEKNLQAVRRAVISSCKKEGRDEKENLRYIAIKNGNIMFDSPYAKVQRGVNRRLLHAWQRGEIKGVEKMEYPAIVHMYYEYARDYGVYPVIGLISPDTGEYEKVTEEAEGKMNLSAISIL